MQHADPLDWLACSHCRRDCPRSSSSSPPPVLTACAHVLCLPCAQAAAAQSSSTSTLHCPACGHEGPVVSFDQLGSSDLDYCFRPLNDLAQELGMAASWQTTHLVEQLAYFKHKCAEQKKTLSRVGGELRKVKALKEQVAQLAADNASLRAQLDSLAPQPPQFSASAAFDARQTFRGLPSFALASPAIGQKRKLSESVADGTFLPPRSATRNSTRSHSSSAGSSIPTNLPLAPPRLSLTPAQQRSTAARSRQGLEVIDEDSTGGATPREVVQGGAEDSMKSRLAKLAYDPSRAGMHRSATSTPVQRPSTQPPVSSAHATNPFFYNPPPPRAAQLDGSTQSYGQSGFSNDEDDDPAALMPPSPVPQRPSQPIPPQQQQQQHRSYSSFVPASTLAASTSAAGQLQQGTPARRPFSAARAAAGAGAVPFAPHDSPRSGSHPQPFRPASVAAMGAGAGGAAAWSGRGR